MCKKILFLILIYFFSPLLICSQQIKSDKNFSAVDSFSISIKYKNDIYKLINDLTKPYSQQVHKTRAIFRWITENIRYDYKHYNKYNHQGKVPKTYNCKENTDCEAKKLVWETRYINKILSKRKTVCGGYTMLFKKMCDIAGLKSEIVTGYVRSEYYQVGTAGNLDHAWNAVWLDSCYYLLDATWAAGGCSKDIDGKLLSFQKGFNNYYWLTPANDFLRNHFPQNNKWVLVSNYTKEKFATNPYYLPNEIDNIKLIAPTTGIIQAKKGDTIQFKLEYKGSFKDLQINSNIFQNPNIWIWEDVNKRKSIRKLDSLALKRQQYIRFKENNLVYEFQYVVTDNTLNYLDILFDTRRIMRFKVKMSSEKL